MGFAAIPHDGVAGIGGKALLVMELRGGPRDRGFAYGEACRGRIARMIEVQFLEEFQGRLTKEQLLKHARKYEPFIEDYSPDIAEELRAIAEGSGRSYDEIVMINALEERKAFEPDHCTLFGVTGKATRDGETFAGQTWDGVEKEWWDGEFGILLQIRRKDGPDILDYTNPGILASAGLNANGIAVNWNTMPQPRLALGVPAYVIVAEVLRQKTLGEALDAVRRAHRASTFHLLITDGHELYGVEGTPDDLAVAYGGESIGHANHFVSPKFEPSMNTDVSSSSIIRHNRMNRLLKESQGVIDLKVCEGFLRDHVNYPQSICCHPGENPDPNQRGYTLDAWICVPSKRELWVAHGLPCQNEFARFSL